MYDNLTDEAKKNVLTHTLQTVLGTNVTNQFIVNRFAAEFEKQCKLEASQGNTKKYTKDYTSLSKTEKKKIINQMKKRSSTFSEIYIYYRHSNMGVREIARKLNVNAGTVSRVLKKIRELE